MVLSLYKGLLRQPLSGPCMREIIAFVAAKHGLTPSDLIGPNRRPAVCRARQEAMYWCRAQEAPNGGARWTLPKIAATLGRDHTTVLHGVRAHKARMMAPKAPMPSAREARQPAKRSPRLLCVILAARSAAELIEDRRFVR